MEASFKAFDKQAKAQQKLLEQAHEDRERLTRELPKATSALYKRISSRIRDGVAVAEARNGACTACYMALRPQIMSQVRRGDEVITCDNCNRILYYAPNRGGAAGGSVVLLRSVRSEMLIDRRRSDMKTAPEERMSDCAPPEFFVDRGGIL